jgi:E3 ubiquitin-protein ligase BOI-like protein
MLGGNNNGNRGLPGFLDETQIQYQNNAANQLQLFGNCEFFPLIFTYMIIVFFH